MSQRAFESVKAIYTKLGITERAEYSIFEGPHEIHGVEAFQFFDRWLQPRKIAWSSKCAFRLHAQVEIRSRRCSQAPAVVEHDFGNLDPNTVEIVPKVPFRVETFFGSSRAKVHFVVPDAQTTNFTIYFDTHGGDRRRYGGLVGHGDFFREEFGRREIGPSHFDALADLDNDGDLDFFKGGVEPFVYGYENVGKNRFVERGRLPFKLPCSRDNRSWVTVAFYDIDSDGDQDFFPSFGDGPDAGKIIFYRNTGQVKFERVDTLRTASGSALAGGAQAGGCFPSISFVRGWDGADPNRLDALVGSNHRCWLYRGGPAFADPELVDVGTLVNPRFDVSDIDKDGDLDLFAGTQPGAVHFFENMGTRSRPTFAKGRVVAWTGKYLIGDAHSGVAVVDSHILSGRFWERTDLNRPEQPRDYGGFFRNRFPEFVRDHRAGPFTEQFHICDAIRQNSVRARDWDGDAKPDLLAGDTDGFIWFFRNRGGAFAKGERLPFSVTDSGGHARFDIAGSDLLVADGSGTVTRFSKKGAEKLPIQLGGRASLLVCDWNNDGHNDLILADDKGYYLANDGKDPQPILFGGRKVTYVRPNLGAFVDWDGDGRKDLIGCHFENTIRFYRNIGSATAPEFADPEGITILKAESPQMISGADVVDWNGDGDLDILTGQGHGGSGLRFYERDWIENELAGTQPVVTALRIERRD